MVLSELAGDRLLVRPDDWLRVVQSEYLSEYVAGGGSAVKVVSGSDATLNRVRQDLQYMATAGRYFYADLDPTKTNTSGKRVDLHRMDQFFFAVTATVDWKNWAAIQARRYLESRGIFLREGRQLIDLDGIAADNQRAPEDLLNQYQAEFSTPQIRDVGMAFEFRAAVTALGRAQLIPDSVNPTTEEILLEWFAGRTLKGGASSLKKVQIHDRINQSNARPMLASFTRWLPQTGYNGLIAVLDLRPYEHKKLTRAQKQADQMRKVKEAIARNASHQELATLMEEVPDPVVSYSDTAFLQMLILIRHFIDEIDWFERLFLVLLTTPKFYDIESQRNYFHYDALQTRIGLEVHDARKANPSASLVHLAESS